MARLSWPAVPRRNPVLHGCVLGSLQCSTSAVPVSPRCGERRVLFPQGLCVLWGPCPERGCGFVSTGLQECRECHHGRDGGGERGRRLSSSCCSPSTRLSHTHTKPPRQTTRNKIQRCLSLTTKRQTARCPTAYKQLLLILPRREDSLCHFRLLKKESRKNKIRSKS